MAAPDRTELLANCDFATGLGHWYPAAEDYFLPLHIDNLALEILIERGGLGLAVLASRGRCFLALCFRRSGFRPTCCVVPPLRS